MIHIQHTRKGDPNEFKVTVKEKFGETNHQVTMDRSTYLKLTDGKVSEDRCIFAAFEFLLEREPKESILTEFDISLISSFFPSFESDLKEYL